MARLRTAIADNKETTVEFTGADLNALFARDPDFEDLRGRVRIEIADSTMTIAVSAPLSSIPLPENEETLVQRHRAFQFHLRLRDLSASISSRPKPAAITFRTSSFPASIPPLTKA